MKTICAIASGVMAIAITLLIYADLVSALSPANAVAPNSLVEIIDGTITGPLIVNNDGNDYPFAFEYTMAVPEECCPYTKKWIYTTECWEDDTFSDDFIGPIESLRNPSCTVLSEFRSVAQSWEGTYMHDTCGTGSDWEMEYWYDSASPTCGLDEDTDPSDWQLEQPNQ
ncbi:MAG: hypothetical protein H6841_08910 [Planctomycetes bacterium]|nr:hypothetical protein [Planctomycetota bacterium]MCB9936125.1 hypothetical protein [Planctomycetota bacterium]